MNKKWFQSRLISLVKPEGMSNAEFQLKCAIRGIDASADDPAFMTWAIDEAYSNFSNPLYEKVRNLIVKGLKCHCILDFNKDVDCSYVCELIPKIVLREHNTKSETEKLFSVILEEYRGTKLWEVTCRINKAIGITTTCYFDEEMTV